LAAGALERRTAARVRRDHYPAPFALIDHWRRAGSDRQALLAGEAERVAKLVVGDRAQGLIRVFQLQERLKGLGSPGVAPAHPAYPPSLGGRSQAEPPPVRRVQVIGAGNMGADIAAWCAQSGLRVALQDLALDQIDRAMGRAAAQLRERLRDPRERRDAWDRLMPDPRGEGLASADLVIEAVVEDAQVKRRLFQELEGRVRPEALLASNTSSIPLEELGDGLARPQRLIGLHFFNPVARMQLVEVVQGALTDTGAVTGGLAFVRAIDRLPLPVKSSPGFLVNRVLMPYLLEAVDLLEEGVPAPVIDRAAVAFGMPMGPLALADSVGLDICLAVAERLGSRLSAPEAPPPRLRRMLQDGLLGRKGGEGFYRYRNGKALARHIPWRYRPPADLTERLIFRLLNECVASLREGVVADADLLDAGVVFGTGFAPFRGGPLHYCERGGWVAMRARIDALERHHGGHFHPDLGWGEPHAA
jgi:3-hydroxyacyl-CoA dehydrogenase/enoyl-CoA hydratase/3-hydroxybutyryl-CoA epimerase